MKLNDRVAIVTGAGSGSGIGSEAQVSALVERTMRELGPVDVFFRASRPVSRG